MNASLEMKTTVSKYVVDIWGLVDVVFLPPSLSLSLLYVYNRPNVSSDALGC